MKRVALVLSVVVVAAPACAQSIRPEEAPAHIGERATVEGRVSIQRMPSGEVYLDLYLDRASRGDNAPLSAYISRWNAARFGDIANLDGRMVAITGRVGSFRYRPEIFLTSPDQIAVR